MVKKLDKIKIYEIAESGNIGSKSKEVLSCEKRERKVRVVGGIFLTHFFVQVARRRTSKRRGRAKNATRTIPKRKAENQRARGRSTCSALV